MHENDLLLGSFCKDNLEKLNEEQLKQYESILQELDPDIFSWISQNKPCPPEFDNEVMKMLQEHVRSNPLNYKFKATQNV